MLVMLSMPRQLAFVGSLHYSVHEFYLVVLAQ